MKITKGKVQDAMLKITVSLEPKTQENYEQQASKLMAEEVSIKGFRKGHVPRKMLLEKFGEEFFYNFLVDKFINQIYAKALQESKVVPVGMPDFKLTKQKPLSLDFSVPVAPEFKLDKLKKVKLKLKKPKVSAKDLKAAIDRELEVQTSYQKTDKAAKLKDRLIIDFEGFDQKGELIEGTKAGKQMLVLGSQKFIPGFEEELVGKKAESDTEFKITFPKDYHNKELQNAVVLFKVHVHSVENPSLPELNPETIEKIYGEKMSKKEFEQKTEAMLLDKNLSQAKKDLESELFESLLKSVDIKPAQSLIDEQIANNHKELVENLKKQNQELESYIKEYESQSKKDFQKEQAGLAEKQVKMRFLMDAINKEFKLEVNEADLAKRIQEEIQKAPAIIKNHVADFYKQGSQGEFMLRNQIYIDKLFEIFVDIK